MGIYERRATGDVSKKSAGEGTRQSNREQRKKVKRKCLFQFSAMELFPGVQRKTRVGGDQLLQLAKEIQ